ncbi:hypothetical protein DFQ27_000713 [Actinomortierella ambigua]|uniref:Ricin B lectin domain-containing protein n=1 Tax=Actinomortierella ambigua TaxID=1343610 RepID=A0A9P6PM48_9FUNG|nr:hypothetical protein DFQ27_000713 [Actinomortierella ambigua]
MSSLRVGFLVYTVLSIIAICVSSQAVKIINYQYQGQSLDVKEGNVVGWHINYDTKSPNWYINAVGGNSITIQNVVSAEYLGVGGQGVVTGADPYEWQQMPVPGGWYQLATTDGNEVLQLTGGSDGSAVILKESYYKGQDAQWGYEPIS